MSDSPKNLYKKLLGAKGELIAVKFLKTKGYKILHKNYKTKFGEADIIALKDGITVFVEVKTRTSLKYGTPAEAVNYTKQQKYRDIANAYLMLNDCKDGQISFAVVEVLGDSVNFIENAF